MRPSEFFRFDAKAYQQKISEHNIQHLRTQERVKQDKLNDTSGDLPLDIILVFLTHGIWIWILMIDDRSITVAQKKLTIIRAELQRRAVQDPVAVNVQQVARTALESLSERELLAVMNAAGQLARKKAHIRETPSTLDNSLSTLASAASDEPPPYSRRDGEA